VFYREWEGLVPGGTTGPPIYTPLAPPLPVLIFIRWNVENVREYEKAGRCSFFNKVDFLLMIKARGPGHLKILLHYWGKQRAYWGKCPSSYIVKNALCGEC
jgi:hypothetical protein